jgi:hypothetical protein
METAARREHEGGYRFESFEAMERALINLVRWPEDGKSGRDWKIRCQKVESGNDPKFGRYISITGVGGETEYHIYEKLTREREDPRRMIYSWEHFREAAVLLELLVTESATIFGGSMQLIMKWLSDHAESIIEDTKFRS